MSRINIDGIVMVRPTHSLKFSKMWGRVVAINPEDSLPIKVKFDGMNMLYGFTDNELMTGKEVAEWEKKKVIDYCYKCGKDLTGQYTYICDDCAFPLPDEGE